MKLNVAFVSICDCWNASIAPSVPTSAVSFCSPMKSLRSGGITRRTACGRITLRSVCHARQPERARRGLLARMDRVDPGAVDLRDVRAVDQDERDDPPEDDRLRHVGEPERGRAEAEHRDHEDRRDAAEEIGVDDRHRAHREEDRPGQAAQHREEEREDQDEDLRDAEDLDVEQERARDLGERRLELAPVEELTAYLRPARRVRHRHGDEREEDRGADERDRHAPAGIPAGAQLRRAGARAARGLLQDRRAGRLRQPNPLEVLQACRSRAAP